MANPKKIKSRVIEISKHGEKTYKIILQLESKLPRYDFGQFVHIAIDDYNPQVGIWPESRVFSITEYDKLTARLTLVYSVVGSYTIRMKNELEVGGYVWVKGPYGNFIIDENVSEDDQKILIAGGTGLSPYISYISEKADMNDFIFYGVKSKESILYPHKLQKWAMKCNIELYIEEGLSKSDNCFSYNVGRLSITKILSSIDQKRKSVFFISGPPEMIKKFTVELLDRGFKYENIIIDDWS